MLQPNSKSFLLRRSKTIRLFPYRNSYNLRTDQNQTLTRKPNYLPVAWLFLRQWKVYVLPRFRHKTSTAKEGGATSCSAPPSFFVFIPFCVALLRSEQRASRPVVFRWSRPLESAAN